MRGVIVLTSKTALRIKRRMALETVGLALRSLLRNPSRSGLTVLGLAIGVAAFIAMVSFGQGARASVVEQFESFGVNLLTIQRKGGTGLGGAPKLLTDSDIETIRRETTTVDFMVPTQFKTILVTHGGRGLSTTLRATSPLYTVARSRDFIAGGMFDELDMKQRSKVCVLGMTPVRELFDGRDPLGQMVTVDGTLRCRVIGVLSPKGVAVSGRDLDNGVLIPSTTYFTYLESRQRPYYGYIDVRPRDPSLRALAREEIVQAMRVAHKLDDNQSDDFKVLSPDDATRAATAVSGILTGLLAGIAGVSLLVGGIGIMNIQLVAVAERTKEIGIRSAIGAAPAQILMQFLSEAVLLALIGTAVGALLGVAIALGVAQAMKWPSSVPVSAILVAVGFGAGVGVLFGYLPAQRAARLDPIEALRRE